MQRALPAFEPDGPVVLAGRFQGPIDLGGGVLSPSAGSPDYDAFIARFQPGGALAEALWPVAQGNALTKETWARVAVDPASHEVTLLRNCEETDGPSPCAGSLLTRFGSAGAEKWHLPLPLTFSRANDIPGNPASQLDLMFDVASAPGGGVAMTGTYGSPTGDIGCGTLPAPVGGASYNLVVARLDKLGACQWSHGYVGTDSKAGRAVADQTLTSAGGKDAFFVRLTPTTAP